MGLLWSFRDATMLLLLPSWLVVLHFVIAISKHSKGLSRPEAKKQWTHALLSTLLPPLSHSVCAYCIHLARFGDVIVLFYACFVISIWFLICTYNPLSLMIPLCMKLVLTSPHVPPGWAVNLSNQPYMLCLSPLLPSLPRYKRPWLSLSCSTCTCTHLSACSCQPYCVCVLEFGFLHKIA